MASAGSKGGGTPVAAARNYGSSANTANAGLHNALSKEFGYTGEFGGGQWGQWAQANLTPEQQARASAMDANKAAYNTTPGPNLATGVMDALSSAARQTNKWSKYTPQQLSNVNRDPYNSPYQQDVIDRTMSEMNRQYGLQQQGVGDQAIGAGAFGGDRHALAQAEMARNQMDQSQNWLANLNQGMFDTATGMAQFDIGGQHQNKQAGLQGAAQLGNLANMGFGWGTALQGMQRQAGLDQFNMNQALLDRQQQQWNNYTSQPFQGLQAWKSGMPNMSGMGSQTTSNSPGLMGLAGLGLQGASLFCWVAREVYGEDNPKWREFRSWMLRKAPRPFVMFYARHGEKIADTIKRRPWLKRILRPAMDLVI